MPSIYILSRQDKPNSVKIGICSGTKKALERGHPYPITIHSFQQVEDTEAELDRLDEKLASYRTGERTFYSCEYSCPWKVVSQYL